MSHSTKILQEHRINLVTSCTDRKSLRVSLAMRSVKGLTVEQRLSSWVESLQNPSERCRAVDLYQGEHWKIAQRLHASANVSLWVASAGYGLIHAESHLVGYSATFVHQNPDDVTRGTGRSSDRREWWNALRQHGDVAAPPLSEIGASGPVLVAASSAYIDAMADEITDAISDGAEVLLVTASKLDGSLESRRIPVEGRFRNILGGSMQALNIRVAEHIVNSVDGSLLTLEIARNIVADLAEQSPPLKKYSRRLMSDSEVKDFIVAELKTSSCSTKSALLRKLRDQGFACEQTRFSTLFSEVKTSAEGER